VLLLYGRDTAMKALDEREAGARGNFAHLEAVVEQQQQTQKEKAEDSESAATEGAASESIDEPAPMSDDPSTTSQPTGRPADAQANHRSS
jgi:hypothetical protein